MNVRQQLATILMAALMLGTILLMPAQFHSQATYSSSELRQSGPIVAASERSDGQARESHTQR